MSNERAMSAIHKKERSGVMQSMYLFTLCDSLKRLYMVEGWENSAPDKFYKTCSKILKTEIFNINAHK